MDHSHRDRRSSAARVFLTRRVVSLRWSSRPASMAEGSYSADIARSVNGKPKDSDSLTVGSTPTLAVTE